MRTETILNTLTNTLKNNPVLNNDRVFINLINELKAEVYSDSMDKSSKCSFMQRQKAALNFLKKQTKQISKIFAFSDIQTIDNTEYQVFTDSYMAFYLKEKMSLPTMDDYHANGDKGNFPDMKRLFPYNREAIDFNVKEQLASLKAKTCHYMENGTPACMYCDSDIVAVDLNKIKTVCQILGDDVQASISAELRNRDRPLLILENENGLALIMPIIGIKFAK